jgi:hypothetical protein
MNTYEFARAVQGTPLGLAIQSANPKLIEGAQLCHVFGLTLVLATVLLLSLRLAGGVLGEVPLARLARLVTPFWLAGLGVTVLSGATLFLSAALVYNANPVFWTKIVLLLVAATVHTALLLRARREQALAPGVARSVGLLSLLLWAVVGISGRAIGFI